MHCMCARSYDGAYNVRFMWVCVCVGGGACDVTLLLYSLVSLGLSYDDAYNVRFMLRSGGVPAA